VVPSGEDPCLSITDYVVDGHGFFGYLLVGRFI